MLLSLFENIKKLTFTANNLVKESEIEQCYIALAERQKLLEQLSEKIPFDGQNNSKIQNEFIELLRWIQQQDKPNIIELESKKQEIIIKSLKQTQTNKAIQQYKDVR